VFPQRRWFEYHCLESEDSCDAELWHRTHQRVTVLAGPDDDPRNDPEHPVYRIRFDDGYEGDAFGDELLRSPRQFERPDYE
jgi:hypothetical protein